MDLNAHFQKNPAIMGGETCFTGTRVPLRVVLGCLRAGESADQILREYPTLTAGHIQAAIAWAADAALEDQPLLAR